MKIIIDQDEIIELCQAHAARTLKADSFEVIFTHATDTTPMYAEVKITTGKMPEAMASTVGAAIAKHVGEDAKVTGETVEIADLPAPKNGVRRNRTQMIIDGDAKNVTPAEQAAVDKMLAEKKEEEEANKTAEVEEAIGPLTEEKAEVVEVKDDPEAPIEGLTLTETTGTEVPSNLVGPAPGVDTLFNND